MKFQVWINAKNENGLSNLMFGNFLVHVLKVKFQRMLQKVKM